MIGHGPGGSRKLRLPAAAHTSLPWRIHELAGGFRLEDVWALPTPGGDGDFPALIRLLASPDGPLRASSPVLVRALWVARRAAGHVLGWDGPSRAAGRGQPTLRALMPADLRAAGGSQATRMPPFTTLYQLGDEWAAEIVNRTVHGVVHLGWVPDGSGGYRGQMAVLVQPDGLLGTLYMAAIWPFRHLIVYPLALRKIGRAWRAFQARQVRQPGSLGTGTRAAEAG